MEKIDDEYYIASFERCLCDTVDAAEKLYFYKVSAHPGQVRYWEEKINVLKNALPDFWRNCKI